MRRFVQFFFTLFIVFSGLALLGSCGNPTTAQKTIAIPIEKHKGAHVFSRVDTTNAEMFGELNLEWVAFVPWGFMQGIQDPTVSHHDGDSLHIADHNAHWVRKILEARKAGFKVFFKPHVWVNNAKEGKWRSDIHFENNADWESWKRTYTEFIVRYAKVAQQAEAEMYCVGVEFTRLALEQPDYWEELIGEVRKVYTGKITYAANWFEEYERIQFWKQLDYIGIQAYFPLVDHEFPTQNDIAEGWKNYLPIFDTLYKQHNIPILFTEMGYKSTSDGAQRPWEWVDDPENPNYTYSLETQTYSYQAFFERVWPKDWFAGAYIWQLRSDFDPNQYPESKDFTPQGKPAAGVIAKGFE